LLGVEPRRSRSVVLLGREVQRERRCHRLSRSTGTRAERRQEWIGYWEKLFSDDSGRRRCPLQ
jgi:hypothetical protein